MIRRTACLIARENDPWRNLAIEQHLMETLPEETAVLCLWQNQPTVMLGRGQDPWRECDAGAFLQSGGCIARRLSGGGAVYQDMGCLNFSFILPKTQFDIARQLGVVGMAAGAFGLQPSAGGRSGLYAAGRKFSDNAYWKNGAVACHHGTLLIESRLEDLARWLTPGDAAQTQNVVNLRQLAPELTIENMEEALYWAFGHAYGAQPSMLDERMLDSRSIERLTRVFSNTDWIYPPKLPYTISVSEQFPWGGVTVHMLADGGVIRAVKIFSDAMEAGLFETIERSLVGSPFLISAISARIGQKMRLVSDAKLLQMAGDVDTLICGHLRRAARG